jgi:WD40 repeat protein
MTDQILAQAGDNNEVYIFDINSKERNPITELKFHKASVRGISFSPLNKLLLSSVSIDKSISFYDITKGKRVSSIVTPESLQSISFNCDGHTVAVGACHSGKIYLYDLRN